MHPSWIDIDHAALAHNTRTLKKVVGANVALCAVIKGNAYGHGMVEVARTVLRHGADRLAVAYLNEALALRAAGIAAPVLIMAYTPAAAVSEAVAHDCAFSVSTLDVAQAASRAACMLQKPAQVHIKIDTGMSRLGVLTHQAAPLIAAVRALPGIHLAGLFTHFSCADSDEAYTQHQLTQFVAVLNALPGSLSKHNQLTIHAANSAGTLAFSAAHFNMVRCGIALYGLTPFKTGWGNSAAPLKPVLSWKAQVALVKTVPAGTPVSYGNTYVCETERTIAVVPVGYADGFRRTPNHFGEVLVRGQRAALVGRVCMDQCMIDVTTIPDVSIGDEVVIIGEQGDERISAEDVAARLGTLNYEVTSALLERVPRINMRDER
jgi:alanine racemase